MGRAWYQLQDLSGRAHPRLRIFVRRAYLGPYGDPCVYRIPHVPHDYLARSYRIPHVPYVYHMCIRAAC